MTTPELAAKWQLDQSELQVAFDYLDAHGLRFLRVVAQRRLMLARTWTPEVVNVAAAAGAKAIGINPTIFAILLQLLADAAPILSSILQSFLEHLLPTPPATPAPTVAPKIASAVATASLAIMCLLGTGCHHTPKLTEPPPPRIPVAYSQPLPEGPVVGVTVAP